MPRFALIFFFIIEHVINIFQDPPAQKKKLGKEEFMTENESKTKDGDPLSLVEWAIRILNEADPQEKVALTFKVQELWNSNKILSIVPFKTIPIPPEEPPRKNMEMTLPGKAVRRGKGGTLESRIAILHSLANIEQWAIDLSWDIIASFATWKVLEGEGNEGERVQLPNSFFSDYIRIAGEEAKHFSFLLNRLTSLGSFYGALPIHGSLWDSAKETRDSLLCRLAIVHMVHEARGLDVNPKTIEKFVKAKDMDSVEKLKIIHEDEVGHVATGQKWFTWICEKRGFDKYSTFWKIVRERFRGQLKPPFNEQDRLRAGLDIHFYGPLAEK